MKKNLTKILIFIMLSFQVFQTNAGLKEQLESKLNPGIGAFLQAYVTQNLSNIIFLNNIIKVITSDINKYSPKDQAALLYFKLLIEQALSNPGNGGGVVAGNIPTPVANNGKIPFNGKYVQVDALGNVKVGGKYFFPICIYGTTYWNGGIPSKLEKYKLYGFNCVVKTKINQEVLNKIKASGMKIVLQTGLSEGQFRPKIELMKKNNFSNLLFYYTDNEGSNRNAYSWHKTKKNMINQYDPNGHPIYFLNGNPGDALSQDSNGRVSDITGSYVYERRYSEAENGPAKIITLENNGTKQPVVMAQLNFGVGGNNGDSNASTAPIGRKMTPIAMASVAVGAKGIGYWRDWGSNGPNKRTPVENVGFIKDLQQFSKDIHKLMNLGIIQQSHRTFKANCGQSDSTNVQIGAGTRRLNGVGYIIISNWNNGARNVSCTTQGLGYSPKGVVDVLKGGSGGTVSGNKIIVNVPAYHRRVIKLVK